MTQPNIITAREANLCRFLIEWFRTKPSMPPSQAYRARGFDYGAENLEAAALTRIGWTRGRHWLAAPMTAGEAEAARAAIRLAVAETTAHHPRGEPMPLPEPMPPVDREWAEVDRLDAEVSTLYRDFDVAVRDAMPRARAQRERALKFGPRPTRSTT